MRCDGNHPQLTIREAAPTKKRLPRSARTLSHSRWLHHSWGSPHFDESKAVGAPTTSRNLPRGSAVAEDPDLDLERTDLVLYEISVSTTIPRIR